MLEYISIFIISAFALAKSGGWLVKSLSNISRVMRWREFVVASIIMAIGSSLPELFVAITSSVSGSPQLSMGNILGSNILALTLIIGVGAVFAHKLRFKGEIMKRSKFFVSLLVLLPFFLIIDGNLSRIDGIILVIAFFIYLREIINQQRQFSKKFNSLKEKGLRRLKLLIKSLAIFFISLILLLLSAQGIVFSATNIALNTGLSLVIIGVLGIAIGTSLPEIIFAIKAIQLNHKKMILGNAIGSIVVNAGLILGITALIAPFNISNFILYINTIAFSVIALALFLMFARSKDTIGNKEGVILISIYLLFFIIEIIIEFIA